jgi:hypothetical protein
LVKSSGVVYDGNTVRVRFEDATILTLLLFLKVSLPLFVIEVGKEIFAAIGNVYFLGFAVVLEFRNNE